MSHPGSSVEPFPVADAVPSYWRKQVGPIDNHRSTEHLPTQVDVVIVGAGYAGASIVHHIVEECVRRDRPLPSILILEAREACSGATGRNGTYHMPSRIQFNIARADSGNLGGHLKPDPLSRAASVLETHGKAVAEHVATFESRQVDAIKELVQRENCDCDFEETRVTDVCFYEAGRDKIKADIAKTVKAGISTAKGIKFTSGSEAEEVCSVRR